MQGQRVAKIGDLEPGQSKEVELKLAGNAPSWGNSLSMLLLGGEWNFNQPRMAPAEIRIKQSVLDGVGYGSAMIATPAHSRISPR